MDKRATTNMLKGRPSAPSAVAVAQVPKHRSQTKGTRRGRPRMRRRALLLVPRVQGAISGKRERMDCPLRVRIRHLDFGHFDGEGTLLAIVVFCFRSRHERLHDSGGVLELGMAVVVDAQPRGWGYEADELGIGCLMV